MDEHTFHSRVLGVATNAGEEELKRCYREMAMLLHPDKHDGSELAKRRFQELQESYEWLLSHAAPKPEPPHASVDPTMASDAPLPQLDLFGTILAVPILLALPVCIGVTLYQSFSNPAYEAQRNLILVAFGIVTVPLILLVLIKAYQASKGFRALVSLGRVMCVAGIALVGLWWMLGALAGAPTWAIALFIMYSVTKSKA